MRQGAVAALIGAGGLGGPLAHALAAAGVRLEIFDADMVEPSNLHRQVQFTLADVGRAKAEVLAERLGRYGEGMAVARRARWTAEWTEEWSAGLTEETAAAGGAEWDVLLDGSDDPITKFAAADWAARRGRPSVIAGALGVGGNVFVAPAGAACFRCLFEEPPDEAPTCADAGVLGPVVAQVAALAASATLRLLRGEVAGSEIWIVDDALAGRPPRRVAVARRPGCSGCGKAEEP